MTGIKFLIAATLLSTTLSAQDKFFTKTGKISFYSKAIIENIEAHNRSVTCVIDTKTGLVQFSVPIKGFEFEKALMQEHFNENYLESDKYPKSTFRGKILNMDKANYTKKGTYPVEVEGDLFIHGVTKHVKQKGTITVDPAKNIIGANS